MPRPKRKHEVISPDPGRNTSRLRSLHALVKEKVNDLGGTLQRHLFLFERETPLKPGFFGEMGGGSVRNMG